MDDASGHARPSRKLENRSGCAKPRNPIARRHDAKLSPIRCALAAQQPQRECLPPGYRRTDAYGANWRPGKSRAGEPADIAGSVRAKFETFIRNAGTRQPFRPGVT